MTEYVLGFLVDSHYTILIRKKRPSWQLGKLKGVGGHIEDGESAQDAMTREFKEETGAKIDTWKHFAIMRGEEDGGWVVWCFWSYGCLLKCKTQTDEELEIHSIHDLSGHPLNKQCIENLPWLFSMIESQRRDGVDYYDITYRRRQKK